jgi:hypothetical protein
MSTEFHGHAEEATQCPARCFHRLLFGNFQCAQQPNLQPPESSTRRVLGDISGCSGTYSRSWEHRCAFSRSQFGIGPRTIQM